MMILSKKSSLTTLIQGLKLFTKIIILVAWLVHGRVFADGYIIVPKIQMEIYEVEDE